MPAKKTSPKNVETNPEAEKKDAKPKKRPVRKKISELSNFQAAERQDAHADTGSSSHHRLHDIKPRNANADASFLAPEGLSFGLKQERRGELKRHKFLKIVAYFSGTTIVLMAVFLIALSYYSKELLDDQQAANQFYGSEVPTQTPVNDQPAKQNLKIAIVNAQPGIYELLGQEIKGQLKDRVVLDNEQITLSAVNADVLFFRKAAQNESVKLLEFFGQYGIKPGVQVNDYQRTDFVLYLSADPKAINLSGYTSAVYNASGKAGEAKRVCSVLSIYKVNGCNALNSPSQEKGTKVFYKDKKSFVITARIKELQNASFALAEAGQIEDIKVVVGR